MISQFWCGPDCTVQELQFQNLECKRLEFHPRYKKDIRVASFQERNEKKELQHFTSVHWEVKRIRIWCGCDFLIICKVLRAHFSWPIHRAVFQLPEPVPTALLSGLLSLSIYSFFFDKTVHIFVNSAERSVSSQSQSIQSINMHLSMFSCSIQSLAQSATLTHSKRELHLVSCTHHETTSQIRLSCCFA
jgi:hypothetical protein